ncbi:MAG TPA: Gfo/Idh/MocA family oxidoreductase [Xanthobacteraceae bacterium]|nr:Gfo/Idh/MocA family oxidoreductase [Xanthobacteraceae bacterium]
MPLTGVEVQTPFTRRPDRPRVGFLGVGWIGLDRMKAIAAADAVEIAAIADPLSETLSQAAQTSPDAKQLNTLEELLTEKLDGLVIATPTALHAEQSIRALESGLSVFCQKPLGRTADETESVVTIAREANRLLAVDLSYRFTEAMRRIRERVQGGEIGEVYAVDLVFHNAYGPDKPWFRDPKLAGGGCVIDLGVHLVDLALWILDFPKTEVTSADLFANGKRLTGRDCVEDYAVATLELSTGVAARLACSWNLHAGRDALISATFFGTKGGAQFRNENASFYDFTAEIFRGTSRETIASPPDAWPGRAAANWAKRLAAGEGFDPKADRLVQVARVLDQIYAKAER